MRRAILLFGGLLLASCGASAQPSPHPGVPATPFVVSAAVDAQARTVVLACIPRDGAHPDPLALLAPSTRLAFERCASPRLAALGSPALLHDNFGVCELGVLHGALPSRAALLEATVGCVERAGAGS